MNSRIRVKYGAISDVKHTHTHAGAHTQPHTHTLICLFFSKTKHCFDIVIGLKLVSGERMCTILVRGLSLPSKRVVR